MKWLRTFIVAAEHENFRKASEELYLTQPAITNHIKRLEEHLSIELFERVGKRVTLSAAGYKFLPHALVLMEKYEEALEEFEGWKQGYTRRLTVAVAPQIASSLLPSFLQEFIEAYPDIEVMINVVNSFEIGEMLSLGKADVGLSRIQSTQTDVECRMIHQESVILVAPQNGVPLEEEEALQKYRVLTHNHPSYWNSLLTEIKKQYPRIRTIPVTQVEITKQFIEKGLGVSYLPLSMVQEELGSKRMIEVAQNRVDAPISFTYVVTKFETTEVNLFIECLLDSFQKEKEETS